MARSKLIGRYKRKGTKKKAPAKRKPRPINLEKLLAQTAPKPSVIATARAMLDVIDVFLTTAPPDERRNLWNVMSALRGPDIDDTGNGKEVATVPIRRAAFPKVSAMDGTARTNIPASFGYSGSKFSVPTDGGLHFIRHARDAARALGLE